MKKKAIEKIAYITIPEAYKEKDAKYVGITALQEINHEPHIFLEVYRNEMQSFQVPVVRYAATAKDWGVYFPETGVWTRQKITTHDWHEGMCWSAKGECGRTYGERKTFNQLYSPEDLVRIKDFFSEIKVWNDADWWEYFERHETNIKNAAEHRKYQLRRERIKERCANTPALPKKQILEWANGNIFGEKHFIYYKKKGRRATICCTKCGGVKEGAWKHGESFESQFESLIEEPRDRHMGKCPLCGIWATYKPQGKARSQYSARAHTFTADKYKGNGLVIRYIELAKSWVLEEVIGPTGDPEMHGAYEKLEGVEIARTYFEKGKGAQTDFHKHNPWSGEDYWDDCNSSGLSNITVKAAPLHPSVGEEIRGTFLQYSAIELFGSAVDEVNAGKYLERYQQMPQIEMLVKLKFYKITEELVNYRYGVNVDVTAKTPEGFFGIRKKKMKMFIDNQGDMGLLRVLQMEKRMGADWTEEQVKALEEMGADQRQLELVLGIMTLQKALNLIAKYAGCEFGTGCSTAMNKIKHTATTYFDYLSMRSQLGYDLQNTVYQRPRHLGVAHNKMVAEIDAETQDKRLKEVEEEFPLIRKKYRKLRNRFFYEDDDYIIRPARSAEEIVQEGRMLHHCVGGDGYLRKHNAQESIILMLRYKDSPEIPYITVEIRDEKIVQWYGAQDKKPDEKNMQRWLDAYVTRLKCKRKEADAGSSHQGNDNMLMPAI